MSDTPRTDAVRHNVPELAMFARQLERELAEARAYRVSQNAEWNRQQLQLVALEWQEKKLADAQSQVAALHRELAEERAEKHLLAKNLADAQSDIAEEIKQGDLYRHELAEARAQVSALRAVLASDAPRTGQTSTIGTLLDDTATVARRHDAEVAARACQGATKGNEMTGLEIWDKALLCPTRQEAAKVIECELSKVKNLLRETIETIEAHEVTCFSCDRDGEKYCDCMEYTIKRVKSELESLETLKSVNTIESKVG